jgi:hypothetical protein
MAVARSTPSHIPQWVYPQPPHPKSTPTTPAPGLGVGGGGRAELTKQCLPDAGMQKVTNGGLPTGY